MNTPLTWFELAALSAGQRVTLAGDMIARPQGVDVRIPAGTRCRIVETGLNEIWGGLVVEPDDAWLADRLRWAQDRWDGCFCIWDTPSDDAAFAGASPFVGEAP